MKNRVEDIRLDDGNYPTYAWPGGYPLYYVTQDGGILCPNCVNENKELVTGVDPQWHIIAHDVNYEDTGLYCDNCYEEIKPAYTE